MPIFDMYGGRSDLYTENELDRRNNPEKYNYTQAQYDAFIASLDAKGASRQAVDTRSREIVPTSYANFGTAGTNPGFSLAGMGGHTSGGLAGNAGTAQYAEGGMVEDVQYMQLGGMASPYADPMGGQLGGQILGPRGQMGGEQQQQGVGGLFQNLNQNKMGMMRAQMGGAPLQVYSDYLNNIYTAPAAETSQEKVTEFIDMVDQAERAHFGAEESFGYGGGSYQQGLMSQYQQNIPPPIQNGGYGQPQSQGPESFQPQRQSQGPESLGLRNMQMDWPGSAR